MYKILSIITETNNHLSYIENEKYIYVYLINFNNSNNIIINKLDIVFNTKKDFFNFLEKKYNIKHITIIGNITNKIIKLNIPIDLIYLRKINIS